MHSNIRKRLGRKLANAGIVISAVTLSVGFSTAAIAEEETTPPVTPEVTIEAPEVAVQTGPSTEPPPPSVQAEPSAQAESDIAVTVTVDGAGPAFSGTARVTISGDAAKNAHFILSHTGSADLTLSSTPSGWTCGPQDSNIECSADELDTGNYDFDFTGLIGTPTSGATITVNGVVAAEQDSNPTNNEASDTYTIDGGTISGRVWNDQNKDGQQQNGEPGIPGVAIQALDGQDPLKSITTGANGQYTLNDVLGDDVTLVVTSPDDLVFTLQNQGSDVNDSDANANGVIEVGTVEAGDQRSYDAGLHSPGGGGGQPPTSQPPTTTPPSGPPTSNPAGGGDAPSTAPPATLSKTGSAIGPVLAAGAALVVGGASLWLVARRRRTAGEEVAS